MEFHENDGLVLLDCANSAYARQVGLQIEVGPGDFTRVNDAGGIGASVQVYDKKLRVHPAPGVHIW